MRLWRERERAASWKRPFNLSPLVERCGHCQRHPMARADDSKRNIEYNQTGQLKGSEMLCVCDLSKNDRRLEDFTPTGDGTGGRPLILYL